MYVLCVCNYINYLVVIDSIIKVSGMDEEIRLIDDGFVHICNMVNDLSWQVRVEAATRLVSLM